MAENIEETTATTSGIHIRPRASLTWRLACGFAVVLGGIGILLIVISVHTRMKTIERQYNRKKDELVSELIFSGTISDEVIPKNTIIEVEDRETGEKLFHYGSWTGRMPLTKYSIRKTESGIRLFLKYEQTAVFAERRGKLTFVFDATTEGKDRMHEVVIVILLYYAVAIILVLGYYSFIKAALRPLLDMASKMQELNIQTLHKERLHVEETEDELRAMAVETNHMLDRLDEAYEAQKVFVSEASHELRTPITVLQGYSSMLKRWGSDDPEVLAESVDAIDSEAKSMQELVEKLLFLSRHERRKMPFQKEWFDLSEILRELEKEMKYLVKDTRIITYEGEQVSVYGDKQALKQAFRVFLDNAVKYTSDGDTIAIRCQNKRNGCEVRVEDSGLGMKKEDLEGIFTRFFRSDTVRGKNIEGHGLGLSIARLIIDGHAGRISVRSQYTKGTVFTILLPYQRGEKNGM